MKKKQQKIQIALISIGLLLIISTYFYYPLMKKAELAKNQPQQKELEKNITHDKTTFFEDVEYNGLYDLNKPFIIGSEEAYILNEEPDIVNGLFISYSPLYSTFSKKVVLS